ncbi:MAG: InlB B-repeat-containing protein, partial [Treponemataceae bacterium]|nr:InlB B-repeat-containing protein [Treponemataceae bacterium]
MPAYQLDGDEIRGAEINISIATKNSVTITDVSFEPLTTIPSDQVIFFTSDYDNFQRITGTGKDNCVVLEVAGQKEAPIRFVMEKETNSKIEWDNSCSFVKFENKSSATVAIPEDKDYPVLKNTSNTSQTYKLYIDETWTIVIEDKIEEATINFVTCYDHSGIVVAPITAPIGNQVTLSEIENQSGANFYAIFEGWYENVVITQEGTLDFSSAILVTSPYTVTKDVTLYAKWKYSEPNPPADPDFPNDISFAAPNGVTISKTDSEFVIENANSSQDENIWSIGVSSEQNFEMKEGQNYKVSVEVKADSEKEVLFRFKDILHSESHAQKKVTVNTEWQTVVFETGSWQADWESIFQVFMGMVDKIYLRNLKIETLDTKVLPVAASEKSILSNITEDGFTVQIDDTSEWISIEGQKVEFGNLYLVSFNVVAEEETNIEFFAKASTKKYADAWYKTTIGTASTKVELYVPHVGSESEFDFIDMGFNSSVATTLTVSNFEVATVPMDEKPAVVIALKGENNRWDQFMGHLGSGTFFTLASGESVVIFAHIGAENFDNWDVVSELRTLTPSDFCSVSVNSDGRPVITNNTNVNRKYILCVNSDYLLVVTDMQPYQVTFDPNGGTIDGSSSTVTKEVYELLDVTPVKDGYTFVGWVDVDGNIVSETKSGITVYAKWSNNLELFANGDIVGDFSVVKEGETYVYDDTLGIELNHEGNGIYTATFTYQDYMTGWNSPYGTCQFKLRTSKGNWGGTSYGIADSTNQPIIGGDAVLIDSVQGNNIVVTGFVVNTTYKITVTCSQDGTVTVQVATVTE